MVVLPQWIGCINNDTASPTFQPEAVRRDWPDCCLEEIGFSFGKFDGAPGRQTLVECRRIVKDSVTFGSEHLRIYDVGCPNGKEGGQDQKGDIQ